MISIVMTCHNRRHQLINTLNSIAHFYKDPIEVIIVDDTDKESEMIMDLPEKYPFPTRLLRIKRAWVNPCVSYNIGFNEAAGEKIIIQNAECIHIGDILNYVKEHSVTGLYITFAAFSLDYPLGVIPYDFEKLHKMVISSPETYLVGHKGWYNHSKYRPVKYHFCTAITRTDLERLNGFDERYGRGIAHDDCELLVRIRNAGIDSVIVNSPFVIHQWHQRTNASALDPLWQRNNNLYDHKTLKDKLIKAPENIYYVR